MKEASHEAATRNCAEIVRAFLQLGATAYGGPAIMGIMQSELQEKRQWVSKERFVEGLALVNMLPGPGAIQLGIFLGRERGGWLGGLLAGICFMLPAFFIMLALTIGYAAYGATPVLKGALYGLGPVVIGIFAVAVYRLGESILRTITQSIIAVAAAVVFARDVMGIVPLLAMAGAVGVLIFHSRRLGTVLLAIILSLILIGHFAPLPSALPEPSVTGVSTQPASLVDLGSFFFIVGAFSFGGGLSMIAFIQERVVENYHWLTQQEFIDGLALGQVTPGPILMVSAYVGYKLAGALGAFISAIAIFLPSFILMLSILPVFDRVRRLVWTKAAMRGIGPAVIGIISVSLVRMTPYALPDPFAVLVLIATVVALLAWRVGAVKLVLIGALVGVLRNRLGSIPGLRAVL